MNPYNNFLYRHMLYIIFVRTHSVERPKLYNKCVHKTFFSQSFFVHKNVDTKNRARHLVLAMVDHCLSNIHGSVGIHGLHGFHWIHGFHGSMWFWKTDFGKKSVFQNRFWKNLFWKTYAQTTPRPRALWSYKPCSQTIPHTPSLMEPDEVIPHIARIALLGLAQELRAGAHFFTSIKCFVILQCRVVVLLQTVKSICLIPTQWIYSWRICHRTQWNSW